MTFLVILNIVFFLVNMFVFAKATYLHEDVRRIDEDMQAFRQDLIKIVSTRRRRY